MNRRNLFTELIAMQEGKDVLLERISQLVKA
jgi:hypothetical protein